MPPTPDPYRTLGLGRDATSEEIRRAYRRLAKANHPDSAGEAALPRFLAIQAAYEALAGGSSGFAVRRPDARPGSTGGGASPREPWRAEPERARATPGAGRPSGRRPGARPAGAQETTSRAGTTADAGAAAGGSRRGPARGPAPDGAGASAGAGTTAGTGTTDGAGTTAGRSPGPGSRGRRRTPNKATLGSTTYDAAAEDPSEPSWSGGTWYGSSSGTYWTINPKEYADPRKHGPEYQRRARRRVDAAAAAGDEDSPPTFDPPSAAAADTGPGAGVGAGAEASHGPGAGAVASHGPGAGAAAPPATPAPRPPADMPVRFPISLPGGFGGRVALALFGWPPLGIALATVTGELTGCARFAASCVELFGVGTWLAQLAIIAVLLALPGLAAISAMGTLFALAAAVPAAVFLSATGGAREPAAGAVILGGAVAVAYLAGVAFALARRPRRGRVPWPR